MVPAHDEIQDRFYGITTDLVQRAGSDGFTQPGNVIAVGSSIMRLWRNIRNDLSPYKVTNHGFGGSRTWEMLYFAKKLVVDFKPRVVLVYCGSNDINSDEPAEPIARRLWAFFDYLSKALPGVKLVLLSIGKAPQKKDRWDIVNRANELCLEWIRTNQNWHWVDVNQDMFDSETGALKNKIFAQDGLHLTDLGYDTIWKPRVLEKLQEIWPLQKL
jgi:lysophospholipase L1-like esterase